MQQINKTLLEDAFSSARKYYPDEFMCFLGQNPKTKIIDEIVLLPTTNGKTFTSINLGVIPIDDTIIGSLHSHPSNSITPSKADLNFFKRFKVNFILGIGQYNNFASYDENGNKLELELL